MSTISSDGAPDEGCFWYQLLPPGGREIDVVALAPGTGLPRQHRRGIETRQFLTFKVLGEVPFWRVPLPCDFDGITLKWAVRVADFISVWSEPGTDQAGNIFEHLKGRTRLRWLVIETTPSVAPEWLSFVNQWKRPGTEAVEFGRLSTEGAA